MNEKKRKIHVLHDENFKYKMINFIWMGNEILLHFESHFSAVSMFYHFRLRKFRKKSGCSTLKFPPWNTKYFNFCICVARIHSKDMLFSSRIVQKGKQICLH